MLTITRRLSLLLPSITLQVGSRFELEISTHVYLRAPWTKGRVWETIWCPHETVHRWTFDRSY